MLDKHLVGRTHAQGQKLRAVCADRLGELERLRINADIQGERCQGFAGSRRMVSTPSPACTITWSCASPAGIIALATFQVSTPPTDKLVLARTAEQRIVTAVPPEEVVAVATIKDIVAVVGQGQARTVAIERVVVRTAIEDIVAAVSINWSLPSSP